MDRKTIHSIFSTEAKSIIDIYKNFVTLIPSPKGSDAEHKGDDGRFVEDLLRSSMSKYLPKELEVLTGQQSVYYDLSRTDIVRPGFTAFTSGRDLDRYLGV